MKRWLDRWKQSKKQRRFVLKCFILICSVWYILALPENLFEDSTSTVLLDRDGQLLGAKIADDGQWRFPECDSVPTKFDICITQFEDRNFRTHIGISLKGIARAFRQNFSKGRVVSGGSTLTMQLARIMRKNPPRTYTEKMIEMILATRIELRYSKSEILNLYASHAPFGNNVVGLDAAAWRYFGRSADKLSWAESATLAVLPNAPGLIYPGKNQVRLLAKRNRLLKQLYQAKYLDDIAYELAVSEPLPQKPLPLPQLAPHLLMQLYKEGQKGSTIKSSIDSKLQERISRQLNQHSLFLQDNQIFNGAVMISSVQTGEVLAYVGNVPDARSENANAVNCITAPRSTGSILKPLLYIKSLEEGIITPQALVSDVPSHFGGYAPKNFSGTFEGAIPANEALARSLNIPMVHLLNDYGLSKFHHELKQYGMTTLHKPARHYGLSLILGGAEAKLYDLSKIYTQLAQKLRYGFALPLSLEKVDLKSLKEKRIIHAENRAAIYCAFEAMTEVNRPDEDNNWRQFASSQKIAWKTGTSFGFRDGWAIGITPDYVVSVWIGNADGEGRPGLTGIKAAAPLLFDVFNQLPKSGQWFLSPQNEMHYRKICAESGHVAGEYCSSRAWKLIPKSCDQAPICPYHQLIHLNKYTGLRVDSDCESVGNMVHVSWFILPSPIEKFYRLNHPNYKEVPTYQESCISKVSDKAMSLLYPKSGSKLFLPTSLDGKSGELVFEAVHRNRKMKLFWHLDNEYLGETSDIHQLSLHPSKGVHTISIEDENGLSVKAKFEIVE